MSLDLFNLLKHKDLKIIFDDYIFVCERCKKIRDSKYIVTRTYSIYDSIWTENMCYKCYSIET